MRINTNPDVKVTGFGHVEAGTYKLRVKKEPELKNGPKGDYLNWQFEFADPNITATDGESKPGGIFEITTLIEEHQWKLRQLVEACGGVWSDGFDTTEMIGLEFDAEVGIDEYQGKLKNIVANYIPAA